MVRVGRGRGFVVQTEREDHLIITAGHCLPHLPPCHGASDLDERTYKELIGPLGPEQRRSADDSEVVLEDADAAVVEQQRQAAADGPRVEVIDRRSYETMQRLAGAGALPSSGQGQELFRSDRLAASAAEQRRQRLARSAEVLGAAERKLRMALLLAEG